MTKETKSKRSKKSTASPEWITLQSGVLRHCDEKWYASAYPTGWYFYTSSYDNNLGPFKSFEDGLKKWVTKK